ncbi:DUF1847 domain-containing protein [bacterium]|nr:DUF1847 domain-containing protein [bacterium]
MRFGIPLHGDRVAPRCTHADGMLVVILRQGRLADEFRMDAQIDTIEDLTEIVRQLNLDVLICGGVNQGARSALEPLVGAILANRSGSKEEIRSWLISGKVVPSSEDLLSFEMEDGAGERDVDCLACPNPVCLDTGGCILTPVQSVIPSEIDQAMLDLAQDLNFEDDRRLCRLSELVYFCLEMGYHTLGVAYCSDLHHPATILTSVLRRFFHVHPVSCKLRVAASEDRDNSSSPAELSRSCNPLAQAAALNRKETDLNILVGLCIGADCVFSKASLAPVTTLFNKDRALANNPIGAIYSERYLREAMESGGAVRSNERSPYSMASAQLSKERIVR